MKILRLKAELKNLSPLMDFIRKSSKEAGFESATVDEILLACEEIIVNVINYAYKGRDSDDIEIQIEEHSHRGIHVNIVDWGNPFDILSVPTPDVNMPLEERTPGGLGIMLAKHFMDKVSYRYDSGMNIVSISKSIK